MHCAFFNGVCALMCALCKPCTLQKSLKNTSVYDMNQIEQLIARCPSLSPCKEALDEAVRIMTECFAAGGKMLVAGNGGSAADSDHISGELLKGFVLPRALEESTACALKAVDAKEGEYLAKVLQRGLPCIPLTGHSAVMTATMNDNAADAVFAQQVISLGKKDDVFFGISTSGSSRNVVLAAAAAKALGMKVVSLTGRDGGKVKAFSDAAVVVPEKETYKIQELHLPVYHALCLALEEAFFG